MSCVRLLDNSGQFNDVDMEVVASMLFMIRIWIHCENAFVLHTLRDKAPLAPRSLAAVCSWAACFFRRYAEEHIQKTGVAIETQGFTFITSGRKRESLTVRAAWDCRRARWCWLCTSFLVLLEWASFRKHSRHDKCIVIHWRREFTEFSIHMKPQHRQRSMQNIPSANLRRSPAPLLTCHSAAAAVWRRCKWRHAAYEMPWETPASLFALFPSAESLRCRPAVIRVMEMNNIFAAQDCGAEGLSPVYRKGLERAQRAGAPPLVQRSAVANCSFVLFSLQVVLSHAVFSSLSHRGTLRCISTPTFGLFLSSKVSPVSWSLASGVYVCRGVHTCAPD